MTVAEMIFGLFAIALVAFIFFALVGFAIQGVQAIKSKKQETPTIGSAEYGIEQARSRLLAEKAIAQQIKELQAKQKELRELKKYI